MITLEEFQRLVAGEDGQPTNEQIALAQRISEAYEKDVQGLKNTNILLKDEKKKLKDAHDADIEKFAATEKQLQEELKKAQEQIQSNSPEEAKKYYETQKVALETAYKSQLSERDKRISEYEASIKDYEAKDLLRSQEVEFERRIRKTNADPGSYDIIRLMVLGDKGDRFTRFDTADGNMFLAKDGSGKSIENVIDEFLQSPTGKRLCNFGSSGSGAEGGAKAASTQKNPFKRETWNETDQMKLIRENPELAKQLEAAAAAV